MNGVVDASGRSEQNEAPSIPEQGDGNRKESDQHL